MCYNVKKLIYFLKICKKYYTFSKKIVLLFVKEKIPLKEEDMSANNRTELKTPLDDEKIIELYWERNEQAIGETDFKYKNYLFVIAYNILNDKLDCEVACCWAHVRRYLLEAYDNGYLKVEPLLKLVRDLYKIEHDAKDRAEKKGTDTALFQERKMARRTSAKPRR